MDRRQFIDRLKAAGMEREALAVERLAPTRVKFEIVPLKEEEEIPLGQSRFGGLPDLPSEIDWPIWNGQPLGFLMQLNLSDISHYSVCEPLPKSGWLYFFYHGYQPWGYDPKHQGAWRVLFFQGPSNALVRRPLPPGSDPSTSFRACRLSFREDVSTDWPDEALYEVDLPLDDAEEKRYYSFLDDPQDQKEHQILGNPSWIQLYKENHQEMCQFVSNGLYMGGSGSPAFDTARAKELEPGAEDWCLLAQIDSDENVGTKWSDNGRIFFWIREEDLERRDFSNVWLVLDTP